VEAIHHHHFPAGGIFPNTPLEGEEIQPVAGWVKELPILTAGYPRREFVWKENPNRRKPLSRYLHRAYRIFQK
jgi:hypothetical protein